MSDSTSSGGPGSEWTFDVAEFLVASAVEPELIDAARAQGRDALHRLAYSVALLGGPVRYTPQDVFELSGADEDLARTLWRAMGFAEVPDDSRALADADVQALRELDDFLQVSPGRRDTAIRFTRLLGQTMSRVADALAAIVEDAVRAEADQWFEAGSDSAELGLMASVAIVPMVERELQYLFRRHLFASALERAIDADDDHDEVVVGFADVVQFTRLSGQMNEQDLATLLETFEAETTGIIVDRGGRVIKLIGDAVMFTVDGDHRAAELALDMVDTFAAPDRPDLRVGLAHGDVIERQGDVFGATVNLASRLVGFARPGTVLIDEGLAAHLADSEAFDIRPLGRRNLKGIGPTSISVLRRR